MTGILNFLQVKHQQASSTTAGLSDEWGEFLHAPGGLPFTVSLAFSTYIRAKRTLPPVASSARTICTLLLQLWHHSTAAALLF